MFDYHDVQLRKPPRFSIVYEMDECMNPNNINSIPINDETVGITSKQKLTSARTFFALLFFPYETLNVPMYVDLVIEGATL